MKQKIKSISEALAIIKELQDICKKQREEIRELKIEVQLRKGASSEALNVFSKIFNK